MTAPGDRDLGGFTAPSLEEVAAKYDQFTDLYGLTAGDIGIHIGMWSRPDERAPASTLFDLANLAQERQTEYHIETLGLKAGERLLDVGCGTGVPAVRMAQHSGALVTGINISREQLTRAEAAARSAGVSDRVSFRYGNAMALDFPDESFDAVMAIDVYDHLADRQKAFHETARVLRPGGHFMMSDFTLRGTPDEAELAAYMQGWSSMRPGTPAQTIAAAANAGFELIKAENMTQNCVFSGELMGLLYADRHDEIVERYGPEIVAELDAAMPVMRTFIRDHLGYYLFLLRKPAVG